MNQFACILLGIGIRIAVSFFLLLARFVRSLFPFLFLVSLLVLLCICHTPRTVVVTILYSWYPYNVWYSYYARTLYSSTNNILEYLASILCMHI